MPQVYFHKMVGITVIASLKGEAIQSVLLDCFGLIALAMTTNPIINVRTDAASESRYAEPREGKQS